MLSLSHNSFISHPLFRSKSSFSGHPYVLTHRRLSYSTFPDNHQVLRRVIKCDKEVQIWDDNVVVESQSEKSTDVRLTGGSVLWRRLLFASKKVRSILLLNVIALLYEVEAVVDPAAFTVVRFAVASVPFLPYVWRARGDIQTFNSGIELGLWASLGYLMQALALLTSDAGRASFISMFTELRFLLGLGLELLCSINWSVGIAGILWLSRSMFVSVVALSSLIWYFIGGTINGSLEVHPSSWTWTMLSNWIVEFPWIPALYTGMFTTGLCLGYEVCVEMTILLLS
ncbi:hypothetical protein Tco_0471125 [Tanacetum coccineum]